MVFKILIYVIIAILASCISGYIYRRFFINKIKQQLLTRLMVVIVGIITLFFVSSTSVVRSLVAAIGYGLILGILDIFEPIRRKFF